MPGESGTRDLVVTPDHLFLMHDQKALKPVQTLLPGDGLTTKDGQRADVVFANPTHNLDTSVHSLMMDGDFDGVDPSGHLVNTNGVITADYIVQIYYETLKPHQLATCSLFAAKDNDLIAGTPEYAARYPSAELQSYLNDPSSWLPGLIPYSPAVTIHPPREAVGFLSEAQAADIRKNAEIHGNWNNANQVMMLRLFKEHRAYYPDTICLIDGDAETPNAYAWYRAGQKHILFTGPFLRISGLYREAHSLVLAVQQAHLNGPKSGADADYEAVAQILRVKSDGPQYVELMTGALEQLALLFGMVSEPNREGARVGTTVLAGIDDRLQIYDNAIRFKRPTSS